MDLSGSETLAGLALNQINSCHAGCGWLNHKNDGSA